MIPRVSRLINGASLVLAAFALQPLGAATPSAEEVFEQGIQAFRAGDYLSALESFRETQRAGVDTPSLHYNLGTTYYWLQRYPEAENEFQLLARDPQWAALAHYNLGLVAQRSGREQEAIEYFERVQRTTVDLNLRALALTALERLGRSVPPARTATVLSLGGGYDSNVALSQDTATLGSSNEGDVFVDALAAASRRLTGNSERGSHADGGLVLRKYAELDQYDLLALRGGLSYATDSGRLRTSAGGYLDLIYSGGELFERDVVGDIQVRRLLDAGGDLRGRYRLARTDGGSEFDYLDGWQQRFTIDRGFAMSATHVRVAYELELNNRTDLQQGAEFFSYSPTRHSLSAMLTAPNVRGWSTEVRGDYRTSRYNDPDRLNGGTLVITREDKRYGVAMRGYRNRRLSALWRVFFDYSYYKNDSNLDNYDYSRHQLLAGVEATLEK